MKRYLITILIGFNLFSCLSESKKDETNSNQETTTTSIENTVGERIDGPANVRDTINGKIIFKLYDNVLVESTPEENDWNVIGIMPSNPKSDYNENLLKKGVKILVDDQVIGETLHNVEVIMGLSGYTHKNNIRQNTIIENALKSHLISTNYSRKIEGFKSFIADFNLEKDEQFEGLVVYYKYENWIDDPSPMMRIGLVFENDKLISILHSRSLIIKETTDHKLDYAFDCLTYNDVSNTENIVKRFNHFVNSVD